MTKETVCLRIEHHAVLFALLARQAVELCGEKGKESILRGMTVYGKERGRRMACNARKRGDEINTMTNQAYGEWKPDFDGQMEFGQIHTQPTLQTYIAKCAWCDAWEKHGLTEYGRLYCVNVDNAVYQGYQDKYVCTQENEALAAKKKELGASCMKDFTFHTAHLRATISRILIEDLGDDGQRAVDRALAEFAELFGQECLDVLDTVPEEEIYPKEAFV